MLLPYHLLQSYTLSSALFPFMNQVNNKIVRILALQINGGPEVGLGPKTIINSKSLGGFHLARQNLIELKGLDLMCIVMIRQ